MNPMRSSPPSCCAWTCTRMFLPVEATAGGGGGARVPGGLARADGACDRDQHAPTPDSTPLPHKNAPWLLPGAGRHQVVDNVRRDENQQIAPRFLLGAETEQLPEDRQVYKEGDSGLGHRDLRHREATDDRGFTVVHQDLVVRLLRLE